MQTWVSVFIVVASVAIVVQVVLLAVFYTMFLRLAGTLNRIATNVETKVTPILDRADRLLAESEGQFREIVSDARETVALARATGQRFDRLLDEAADRLRQQIIRADRMVTGALEAIEDSGTELRRSVIEPMRTATAFVRGVRAGVDFFRGRSRAPERRRDTQDEGLFI
ncbi:MAG: hypothetical protein KGL59_07250 [Acidobacteriota bacterium]|nr:hypothetical protein [Acidobacteriota bacterium]